MSCNPPSSKRVARRALVLAAVANRGLIENERPTIESPDETREAMLAWIREAGADDEPEPEEWEALRSPVGGLDSQATVNAVWRVEGLAVLLWALGNYELPPYDQLVTPAELFQAVHLFDANTARASVRQARLCEKKELSTPAE